MTQREILHYLLCNTHTLFTTDFLSTVNDAFGTDIAPAIYRESSDDPKGLTLDNGAKIATGMAAFDLATILCDRLKVGYIVKMGRGFQVQACVEALRAAGYGKADTPHNATTR